MKTIDITAKEWFDKVNGNSYFSAVVTIDFSLPTEQTIKLPFQYGYDNQYQTEVVKELQKKNLIPDADKFYGGLPRYCRENNIVLNHNKQTKCLKRDVVAFGIE